MTLAKLREEMPLDAYADHLEWLVEEMTTPPPEYDERLQCLSPAQRRMVALMLRASGEAVPHSALMAAGEIEHSPDSATDGSLKAQICYARRRLAEAGVTLKIYNEHSYGYRVVE